MIPRRGGADVGRWHEWPRPRLRTPATTSFSFLPSLSARSFTSRTSSFGKSRVIFTSRFCWFSSFLAKVGLRRSSNGFL